MINNGKIKTTISFVEKIMFSLDSVEKFLIRIDMLKYMI